MSSLSARMRDALEAAAGHIEGLRRTFDDNPGAPRWPHHPATLAALVRHGLLEPRELRNRKGYRIQAWFITDAGRKALEPVLAIKRDAPLYLAHSGAIRYRKLPNGRWEVDESGDGSGDYTSDPGRSIDHDLLPGAKRSAAVEVLVGPVEIAQFAKRARQREHERKQEAGRLLDDLSANERLERARRMAREQRLDFNREERLIRFMLASGREHSALQRLAAIEVRLGQRAA